MRVLVAMSGGVDSSVAAALLRDEGHDVVGCTLRLWGGESDSGCCSAADVDDARRVAQVLDVPHHVFDLSDRFDDDVVAPYVASHAAGETPNPCVACNRSIKFGELMGRGMRLGFDAIATGHHARVVRGPSGPELRRGADRAKDQSYVLGFLRRQELERTLLPVGELTKPRVRALAASLGLRTAAKPDSQDVCFVPRGGRAAFLSARTPLTRGRVVDRSSGADLGSVDAVELVTVGQRRGIARGTDGSARVVVDVDAASGTVLVAEPDRAASDRIVLDGGSLSWTGAPLDRPVRVLVQASAHGAPVAAVLRDGAQPVLHLTTPSRPIAPGQLAVLYDAGDGDRVLGAATVARGGAAA